MRAVNLRKFLTRLANCRRVDDRQHFIQVRIQQAEEQRFVVVLDRTQVDVLVQIACALVVLAEDPCDLFFNGLDVLRQQPDQIEFDPLLRGESTALVQQGHFQQRRASIGNI